MPHGQVLEFTRVTKRFNDVTAVSELSARVEPGVVTAFLGPNGAGKTTSLRILLGQVRPTSGTATIGGVAYSELRHPLRTIGSVLEETVYRPRRSASRHLTIAAKANGIPLSRVDEVLSLVGLEHEADGRVGSFSLGMRQRLSVAHALLGDPGALVFDEPANGLDPEGIRWMRLLMRRLADEGRTVLVSSHVLSEVEQVADHVLVLSKGQLVLSSGIETLADPSGGSVIVDSADRAGLRAALSTAGFEIEVLRSGLRVRGGDAQTVGAIAAAAGVALSTLVQRGPTLEDVFIELVRGGTFAPRAVAAVDVVPSEAVAADVESEASGEPGVEAQPGVVPPIDAAVPGVPEDVDGAAAVGAVSDVAATDVESGADAEHGVESDAEAAGDAGAAYGAGAEQVSDTEQSEDSEQVSDTEQSEDSEPASDVETLSDTEQSEDSEQIAVTDETVDSDQAVETSAEPTDADADSAESAAAPAPSFDDILFGNGSSSEPGEEHSSESAATTTADDTPAEASGVEIFDYLGEQADGGEPGQESDDDPRSAAVSSMLAAAARAYYDDEPAEYPLGDADADSGTAAGSAGDRSGEDAQDENAQWSVASTGVIDQVPAWVPSDEAPVDGDASESDGHEGGHGHEGEQQEHEHHEGDHHEHNHHEGEQQEHEHHEHNDGEHRHD